MKTTLEEMKTVASKIEVLRSRMGELDVVARQTRPLIPTLEAELGSLQEREAVIKETLQSLKERRDKVEIISLGIGSNLK
jgi:ABC-type phosphate transport system auxiliary subunit